MKGRLTRLDGGSAGVSSPTLERRRVGRVMTSLMSFYLPAFFFRGYKDFVSVLQESHFVSLSRYLIDEHNKGALLTVSSCLKNNALYVLLLFGALQADLIIAPST